MRTKKFLYNSIAASVQQVVVAVVGLIIPRLMLQYYGSEINGMVSSINQFISYFLLIEAGLSGAVIYELYRPLADKNHKAINGIVSAANKFYFQIGYVFLSLILGFAFIYPYLVELNMLSPISIGLLVIILGMNGVLEFFTLAKYRVLLTADQKTYIIAGASIIQIIVNATIIVVLSKLEVHIVVLYGVSLLSIFVRSIILMFYVRIKYKFLNYKEQPNYKSLNKRWDALYLQILGATQQGAPIIIATIFTTLPLVSVYTIYNMVLLAVNNILGIFNKGLSASFGDVIARGEQKILQKSYGEFEFVYYCIITIVYSITLVTIMPFIRLYTSGITDVNYNVPTIGILFVLNGLLFNLKTPQGMLIKSAGLFKETKFQSTIQALIIVIGGVILAPKLGLIGILIAACFSNLYRCVDLVIFIPKYVTGLSIQSTVFRIIKVLVSIFIIWLTFEFFEFQATNFIQLIFLDLIVGVYSIIIVVLIGLFYEKELFYSVLKRIKRVIRKKK